MSLSEMFSKSKKKRLSSPTSDPDESKRSFIASVTSRVSGLVPARFSQWLSDVQNSASNGITPIADTTDSSEDEFEMMAPSKRKCQGTQVVQHNKCFKLEPTPLHTDSSDIPNNHNVLYTSIHPPPGRNTFMQEADYQSNLYIPATDESNMQIPSLDSTVRDTTYKSPHIASSSGQSVGTKRKSIFDSNPKTKEAKTPKYCEQASSSLSDRKPRFRSSLYGSPFYPGPTMYGGASASTYIDYASTKHQKAVKVRDSSKKDYSDLSLSTRKIFDVFEISSSLLVEAKRIPAIQNLNQSHYLSRSLPSKSDSYKQQELNVPSVPSILRLKHRSRLMDSTKAARQIMASHSSTLPGFHYTDSVKRNSSNSVEKECSFKMKTNLTRTHRGEDPYKTPELVQLPTAVLHIDKDNLPKFCITSPSPPCSTAVNTPSTTATTTSTLNSKPQIIKDTLNVSHVFGNTVNVAPGRTRSENSMFKFASPAVSPVAITENLHNTYLAIPQMDEKNVNKPEDREKLNTFSTKKDSSTRQSSNDQQCPVNENTMVCASDSVASSIDNAIVVEEKDWKCDTCWIRNNNSVKKCIACGGSKSVKTEQTTALASEVTLASATALADKNSDDWKCQNCWIKNKNSVKKCAACGGSKTDGIEPTVSSSATPTHAKQPENDWKCENCWIKNKSSVKKCAACGGSKPDGKEQAKPGSQPESQSLLYKTPDEKLQMIMSSQKNKWVCSGCLIRNEPDKTKCQCCEMEREGPSKEITPKPFTFPKESNINFKFGIDPKEQEKNLAKKTEQASKFGSELTILEQPETNNNRTYVVSLAKADNNPDKRKLDDNTNNDIISADKKDSEVPKVSKSSFIFGIPKTVPEEPSPSVVEAAVAKPIEKPNHVQPTAAPSCSFLATPTSTPTKTCSVFLATSTPVMQGDPQKNTTPAPNNTNILLPAGTSTFGAPSAPVKDIFSLRTPGQSAPAATTTAPSSFFSNCQTATAAVAESSVRPLFGRTEPATTSTAPCFVPKTVSPIATSPGAFNFLRANNNENNPSPFSCSQNNENIATPFASGNNENNETRFSVANNNDNNVARFGSGFRTSAHESAWGANGDATFTAGGGGGSAARDPAPFGFGTFNNQFGAINPGTSANAPTLFGAQPDGSAHRMYNTGANSVAAGGVFGSAQQTTQPNNIFGAQASPTVFGLQNQNALFGAPAPAQQPEFVATNPVFGVTMPTQPAPFAGAALTQSHAASLQNQSPVFGVATSSIPTFGTSAPSPLPNFAANAQNQTASFGGPAQSRPSGFGTAGSSQPVAFGVPAQPAPAPAAAFNFGSGIFNFGQQQAQQQPQQSSLYSFGGSTMGGTTIGGMNSSLGNRMIAQPMDGGMGAEAMGAGGMGAGGMGAGGMGAGGMGAGGSVQFTVGSAPAATNTGRRMRKAVRRNPQR